MMERMLGIVEGLFEVYSFEFIIILVNWFKNVRLYSRVDLEK